MTTIGSRIGAAIKGFASGDQETPRAEKADGGGEGLLAGVLRPAGEPRGRSTAEFLRAYSDMPWLRAVLARVSYDVAAVRWCLYVARDGHGKAIRKKALTRWPRDSRRAMMKSMMSAGDLEEVEEHPMLDLLHRANPLHSGVQARRLTQVHIDSVGEGFQMIERDRLGTPTRLWPIPPSWVRSTPTPRSPFFTMDFRGWQGDVPASEVIWFLDADPANPYGRGSGTARALSDELEIDEYAAKTVKAHFFNRARPDLLVYPKGDGSLTDSEQRSLEEKWNRHNRGFWRAFRTFFLKRPVEIKEIDTSFKSAQMQEIREHERDTILQVFGVSPEVLGIVRPGSARATITMADAIYAKRVLVPRLEFNRSVMQVRLAPQYDENLIVDYDSPSIEDAEQQLASAKASPWALTQDEWREMAGQDPLPDGRGDVFLVPRSMVAVGRLSDVGVGDGGGKRDSGKEASPDRPASAPVCDPAPVLRDDTREDLVLGGSTKAAAEWDAMVRKGHKDDPPAVRLADDSWQGWRDQQVAAWEVLEADVGDVAAGIRDGDPDRVIAAFGGVEAIAEAIASVARDRGKERFLRGAKLGLDQVPDTTRAPLGISFTELNPQATAWAEANAGQLVSQVGKHAYDAIAPLVALANETGIAPAQLARELVDRGTIGLLPRQRAAVERFRAQMIADGVDAGLMARRIERFEAAQLRFRATTIARTETLSALNHGQQAAWELAVERGKLPPEMGREWISTIDDLTDEDCASVDGEVVGMNDVFSVGVQVPPLHPRCRCGVALTDIRKK